MRLHALPTAALFAASALAQNSKDVKCADGLYMVVARGTGEDKGTGITGEIAKDVADRVKGSIVNPLDYPATFQDPDYQDSETDGVRIMTDVLTNYHRSCPDGKIAVLGYSQGGQIATDTFCGGTGDGFAENKPLSTDVVQDSVVAIIMFGDPSHVANASYNLGTSKKDGIFPRDNIKMCEDDYSDIIRSYCDTGDTYCDRGDDEDVHGEYVSRYGDDVADFLVKQYEDAMKGSAGSTATTSAVTATSTASSASETGGAAATTTPVTTPANAAGGLTPALLFAAVPLMLAMSEMFF
ncbi:hypothetical protein FZEAL_6944 [Fusarium zealandicum]|uniref:Acetylxylan esterase n=1 Tax=Fusarium zealandicum TaxID=1053134 RepID=A0A8H4UHB9_9HYPO|nr:hypothetical protein FZEAL_6944 [Fusarium zealandicum]